MGIQRHRRIKKHGNNGNFGNQNIGLPLLPKLPYHYATTNKTQLLFAIKICIVRHYGVILNPPKYNSKT